MGITMNSPLVLDAEIAFYQPILSDWRTFEAWSEAGSKTATERANGVWKRLLEDYEKPYIDESVEEELTNYVARRKSEINQ
jgi:trimethylamine---corrinoid protein Co-methyltransferase